MTTFNIGAAVRIKSTAPAIVRALLQGIGTVVRAGGVRGTYEVLFGGVLLLADDYTLELVPEKKAPAPTFKRGDAVTSRWNPGYVVWEIVSGYKEAGITKYEATVMSIGNKRDVLTGATAHLFETDLQLHVTTPFKFAVGDKVMAKDGTQPWTVLRAYQAGSDACYELRSDFSGVRMHAYESTLRPYVDPVDTVARAIFGADYANLGARSKLYCQDVAKAAIAALDKARS